MFDCLLYFFYNEEINENAGSNDDYTILSDNRFLTLVLMDVNHRKVIMTEGKKKLFELFNADLVQCTETD